MFVVHAALGRMADLAGRLHGAGSPIVAELLRMGAVRALWRGDAARARSGAEAALAAFAQQQPQPRPPPTALDLAASKCYGAWDITT